MRSRYSSSSDTDEKLSTYMWNKSPVYYRPNTSDRGIIYNILIQKGKKAEYYVPEEITPNIIFDIGANIGITAIWMAKKYPDAKILCFEPMQENFEILESNIKPYNNITAYDFGLGESTCTVDIFANEDRGNQGGFSLFQLANDGDDTGTEEKVFAQVNIKSAAEFIKEKDISTIDILKVDTEGAEYEILKSIPEELLSKVQWVMGELHGIKNFETLALLDRWFSIQLDKRLTRHFFQFFGINRSRM